MDREMEINFEERLGKCFNCLDIWSDECNLSECNLTEEEIKEELDGKSGESIREERSDD